MALKFRIGRIWIALLAALVAVLAFAWRDAGVEPLRPMTAPANLPAAHP